MLLPQRLFSTSWCYFKLEEKSSVLTTSSCEVESEDFLAFLSRHDLEGSPDPYVLDVGEPVRSQLKIGVTRDLTLHHLNGQLLMDMSCWSFHCDPAVQISRVFLSPIVIMTLNIQDLRTLPLHYCHRIFPRAFHIAVTDKNSLIFRYSRHPCMWHLLNYA